LLNFKYFPFKYDNIQPFLQLGAGANIGGYVLKPAAGIEYELLSGTTFLFGVEYSLFRFSHQNNWFNASKIGFNYGISYQL